MLPRLEGVPGMLARRWERRMPMRSALCVWDRAGFDSIKGFQENGTNCSRARDSKDECKFCVKQQDHKPDVKSGGERKRIREPDVIP